MGIALLTAGICAATLLPLVVHLPLRGPGTGWGEFAFFRDFLGARYLGGSVINWLALAFVVGIRRRCFEETFLVVLALLTIPLALGLILTGVPVVDNFFIHVLRSRSFAFVGLFVALFAGGAGYAIRRFVAGHGKVMATYRTGNRLTSRPSPCPPLLATCSPYLFAGECGMGASQ
jgi:hypothetical protein